MPTRRIHPALYIFLGILVLISTCIWFNFFRTVYEDGCESVVLSNGQQLNVEYIFSHRIYWSFGHAGGIGGGNNQVSMTATLDGTLYTWHGMDERPFIFAFKNGLLYLVAFDRTDRGAIRFRYYRSNSIHRFEEIEPKEFPKELAIQNAWLHKDDRELLVKMDPDAYWFRESLTACVWNHLEYGYDYSGPSGHWAPAAVFVREYKRKYISATTQPSATPH